jgi:hypothetical protein
MEESFMENPVLPVGPPPPVPVVGGAAEGDGVGFGAGLGDGVGLTFPLAMGGGSPVLRQNCEGRVSEVPAATGHHSDGRTVLW